MTDIPIKDILSLTDEAGRLGMKYFLKTGYMRKSDTTIVTRADIEIEQMVRDRLQDLTPDIGFLGEETPESLTSTDRNGTYWVLDPVDGTASYAAGIPCWAFSLGLVVDGKLSCGIISVPVTGETYYALDGKTYLNGERFIPDPPAELDTESVIYLQSDFNRKYTTDFRGKTRALGSAAYHGLLTCRPTTAAVFQGRNYLWDLAGLIPINEAWGIKVRNFDGTVLEMKDFNDKWKTKEETLIARDEVFEKVRKTLHRKD